MTDTDPFRVYVARDIRIEELEYYMGLEDLLEDPDIEVTFLPERPYTTLKTDDLRGADAVVSLRDDITRETLDGLDRLKIIARAGAGYENLDLDACTDHGVVAVHAPQGPTESVAQATLGMLIVCASNLRKYDNLIREQGFEGRIENMGFELGSHTLGIIGLGLIGTRLVEVLDPFDMDVQVYDPYLPEERAEELGVRLVDDLHDMLRTSDLVSLHVPLTPETEGMLGEEEFRAMKESAYIVNTTRGGIYSDAELARAIREGWIAGAAIDVFEDEPNVEGNPLLELEDSLMTPHIAGITRDSLDRIGHLLVESILNVKNDELPINILNPDVYDEPVPEENLSPSFR